MRIVIDVDASMGADSTEEFEKSIKNAMVLTNPDLELPDVRVDARPEVPFDEGE